MLDASIASGLRAIARQAGDAILSVYATDFDVRDKADRTPVTAADIAASRLIVAGLEALTPTIPVISEEADIPPYEVRRQWSRYWLVDPLDGTREFVARNGEFTVNIALIEKGVPVAGVLHVPVAGSTAWAPGDGTAWLANAGGATRRLAIAGEARTPVRVAASRSHPDAELARWLADLGTAELVRAGSSLKFLWIASGRADVYPRFGPTCEWDSAAGQAIVEAAGGRVVTGAGEALRYNSRDSLVNPPFLVFGPPDVRWSPGNRRQFPLTRQSGLQ